MLLALNGYGSIFCGYVGYGAVVILKVFIEMSYVLIGVGCVYHQQQAVFFKTIEICVVNCGAILIGNNAILGLVQIQSHNVAAYNMLQKLYPVRTFNQETAHVGYVKEAADMAGVKVLRNYARGILDGHFPSAEIHHSGSGAYVNVVKLGAFQFAHSFPPVGFIVF